MQLPFVPIFRPLLAVFCGMAMISISTELIAAASRLLGFGIRKSTDESGSIWMWLLAAAILIGTQVTFVFLVHSAVRLHQRNESDSRLSGSSWLKVHASCYLIGLVLGIVALIE